MELISEKESPFITKSFPKLWLGFCFICAAISGFHWATVLLFIVGCCFFMFLYKKCVEVHVGRESLHIKTVRGCFDMSFNNIAAPIEKTHLLRGAYRINFIAPTEAGNFVVFIPRRSFIFWEHKECKKFLKLINT